MPDNKSERRSFLGWLLGGSILAALASIFYPVLAYLKPPPAAESSITSLKVGKTEDFPLDSGTIFKFGRVPGILIHTPDDKFLAFNATCTHLGCIVQYRKDLGLIYCACHGGKFDLNGKNIAGPPPKPLEEFKVHISGEDIFVSRQS
jgi:Rieske Fe-S protein